jgi:exonuclease III
MILINKHVDPNVQIVRNDSLGRWILFNTKVYKKEIWLNNLYGPSQNDPHFFKNIYTNLLNLQATNDLITMVGDYNTVLSTSMDCKGNHSPNYHHRALKKSNIMDTLEISTIWRLKNPDLVKYTWRRLNQASRLDYFLVPFSLASKVKKVLIGDRMRSDHHLIGIHITLIVFPRGQGYWKFNQSLLEKNFF